MLKVTRNQVDKAVSYRLKVPGLNPFVASQVKRVDFSLPPHQKPVFWGERA